jgi:hypothetical protein
MRSLLAVLSVALLAGVSSSCGGRTSPSMPSSVAPSVIPAPAPTPTPASAPAPPSNATLAISGYHITIWTDEHGLLYFNQKFTLMETGGKSGATIQKIASSVDGRVTDDTGPLCWVQPIRVVPRGILDTFDAGWDSLTYCAPFSTGRTLPARVGVVVNFTDDDGHESFVEATTTVSR